MHVLLKHKGDVQIPPNLFQIVTKVRRKFQFFSKWSKVALLLFRVRPILPVAILEWKKWGALRGQGKSRGST